VLDEDMPHYNGVPMSTRPIRAFAGLVRRISDEAQVFVLV